MAARARRRDPGAMTTLSRRSALLPALAVTLLALTGCAGLPVPGIEGVVEDVVEGALEGQTGVDIDSGANVSVPAEFPSEFPLPAGTLTSVVVVEGTFSLTYSVDDEAVAQQLVDDVTALGFTELAVSDMGDLQSWILDRDGRSVQVGLVRDEPLILTYIVGAEQ